MADVGAGLEPDPRGAGAIQRHIPPHPGPTVQPQVVGNDEEGNDQSQGPPSINVAPTNTGPNPKPVSVKTVPKKCHDTIQVVQEHFINNTLKEERRTAKVSTEEDDREHNYLRSLLTLANPLHKFLSSNLESRLLDVAYGAEKEDPSLTSEHKDKVARALEDSNLTGFLVPMIQKVKRANGDSPIYDTFAAAIAELGKELISTALPQLEEAGFFSEKWEEDEISEWTFKNIKSQWRAAVLKTIYSHCGAENLNSNQDSLPSADSNQLEITLLKDKMRELLVAAKSDAEEKKYLAYELSKVQQESLTAAFLEEERKIRVEPMDPQMWKNKDKETMTDAEKKATVTKLLVEWYGQAATDKIDIFVARDNTRFPPWLKLTFPTMYDKFNFEARMKKLREDKKPEKTFFTNRLTPMEFAPMKKKLIEAATNKATNDWILMVRHSEAEDRWSTDKDHIRRAIFVRVKNKCSPKFSAWCEILDPCHRSMWRALEFDSNINHFGNYDLFNAIPCPDTRSKASTDRSYAKIRTGPKDIGKDLRLFQTTPASRRRPPPSGRNIKDTIADFESRGSVVKRNLGPLLGTNISGHGPGIQSDDPLYASRLPPQPARSTQGGTELEEISVAPESPSQAALDTIQQAKTLIQDELNTGATPLPTQASKKHRKNAGEQNQDSDSEGGRTLRKKNKDKDKKK